MIWFHPDTPKGLHDAVKDPNVLKLLNLLERDSYLWEAAARALHDASKPLSARPASDAAREIRAELRRWCTELQLAGGLLPDVEDPAKPRAGLLRGGSSHG